MTSNSLRDRLDDVRARIARAAGRAGRDPSAVRLVAISKTFPADDVRVAFAAGQVEFGENRVQEALQKMDATADLPLRWHLVGHLQSNKAKRVAARFDVVQSVDSVELLRRLDESASAAGRAVEALVQLDLGLETTKHGASEGELPAIFAAASAANSVRVAGLMLLPPPVERPDDARPYFRRLHEVRKQLISQGIDPEMLRELSMGMSHDFEVAVEEGATIVRVGSAIFGSRS